MHIPSIKFQFFFYKNIKQGSHLELYLFFSNLKKENIITKLKISDHNLLTEKCRQLPIPRQDWLFMCCKILENESNVLIISKNDVQIVLNGNIVDFGDFLLSRYF